jgi:hypothetical protein
VPLTQLETELRLIARQRIAQGKLPGQPAPFRTWGGYGSGHRCDLCEKPIQSDEIEYEVEYGERADTTLRFHLVCQSVWQLEVAREEYLKSRGSE